MTIMSQWSLNCKSNCRISSGTPQACSGIAKFFSGESLCVSDRHLSAKNKDAARQTCTQQQQNARFRNGRNLTSNFTTREGGVMNIRICGSIIQTRDQGFLCSSAAESKRRQVECIAITSRCCVGKIRIGNPHGGVGSRSG